MSLIFCLLAAQAAGQEITTFHPLPAQAQQERERRQAQGLPVGEPAAPATVTPVASQPEAPKPPVEPIKVLSVRVVPPDANVIFVPPPPDAPK